MLIEIINIGKKEFLNGLREALENHNKHQSKTLSFKKDYFTSKNKKKKDKEKLIK